MTFPSDMIVRWKIETLTIPEARRLLRATRGDRHEAAYVLATPAGMRLAEILGLKWSDVDFKHRTLSVQRSLLERQINWIPCYALARDVQGRD